MNLSRNFIGIPHTPHGRFMRPAPVPAAIYDGIGLYLRGKVCTEPDGFCPSILETTCSRKRFISCHSSLRRSGSQPPGTPSSWEFATKEKAADLRAAFFFLQSIQGKSGAT